MPNTHFRAFTLFFLSPAWAGAGAATDPQIDTARLQAHVEFLASDLLEGRATGTPGYDIAARYVASQFQQLGARPAGDNGGWLQTVPLLEASPVIAAGTATLEHDGRKIALINTEDFLPGAYFVEPEISVTAPAVFVGHAISAPELKYDDLAGIDLKGRIAVVLTGAPPTFESSQRAHYSSRTNKHRALVQRGAVGVVYVSTPIDERRFPWGRLVQASWESSARWVDGAGVPFESFPELKGRFLVSRAGATKLFQGAPLTLEQVFANSEGGKAKSFALPVMVTLGSKTTLRRMTSSNVTALIEGSDPKLKKEYIVFTAHLDHLGKGAAVKGDAIYNGALDNATGIGILLEVARYFADLETKPRRSLLFLAVTAEEKGLLGADFFARQPTVPRGSIVANVNMDMPVALTELADVVAYGAEHSSLGEVVARAASREGMTLIPDPVPEEVVFVRSDQYPFVKQGIPAVYLDAGVRSRVPGVDGEALLDAFLRDHYHLPSDESSLPIHYPTLATIGRINARIGLEIANADARPTWNKGDFFGEKFGQASAAPAADRSSR